jgi:hypothetical protein
MNLHPFGLRWHPTDNPETTNTRGRTNLMPLYRNSIALGIFFTIASTAAAQVTGGVMSVTQSHMG